jgi:hypothetical protein
MNQLIPFLKNINPFSLLLPEMDVSPCPDLSGTAQGLWIEPGPLIGLVNGWQIAQWAIETSYRWQPGLRFRSGPGRKPLYPDATVLLTVIVMRVWRKGYESFTGWLERNSSLAQKLGYTEIDRQGQRQVISSFQLSRRARQLGCWPFLLFFIALVWQLIRLGAITGRDLIVDASLLQAWYQAEGRCLATKFTPSSVVTWSCPFSSG